MKDSLALVSDDRIEMFLDVNVLVDAFLFQHADDQPVEFEATDFTFQGDPTSTVMMLIDTGDPVKGKRLVLHSSKRVIKLTIAILEDKFRWSPEASQLAAVKILNMIRQSHGRLCSEDQLSIRTDEGIEDKEDVHRVAEARACGAEVFLTRDGDLLDLGILRPVVMTPRQFIDRLRT